MMPAARLVVRQICCGSNRCQSTDGKTKTNFQVRARIDTPQEGEYYRNGGILPYVLRQLINQEAANG